MIDMTAYIAARSDQMNADDLLDAPRTITVTKVTAQPDAAEQPVSIHYEGDNGKPLKPCKTVRRILVGVWGKDASKYVGRSMTLYRDPTVAFGGMQVGGIRVSHMSHIDEKKTVALQVTRGRKAPFTIQPLKAAPAQPETDAFGLAPVADGSAAPSKAEKWTSDYIEAIGRCEDIDALMGLQSRSAETLAKLKAESGDLHARAVEAGATRAAELQQQAAQAEVAG
jgi:hypothetical protein